MTERARTGGTKEFHYTKEDMRRISETDTAPTREFKKALAMHNFFKDIDDPSLRQALERYADFYELGIEVRDRNGSNLGFILELYYEISEGKYKKALEMKGKGKIRLGLPEAKYRINVSRSRLVFFKMRASRVVRLDSERKEQFVL